MDSYQKYKAEEWEWFENSLSYSNARLPQALLRSGIRFANAEMEATGLKALNWLDQFNGAAAGTVTSCRLGLRFLFEENGEGPFRPAAHRSMCHGIWMCRSLPDDGQGRWRQEAWSAFNWFLGDNDLEISLLTDLTTRRMPRRIAS